MKTTRRIDREDIIRKRAEGADDALRLRAERDYLSRLATTGHVPRIVATAAQWIDMERVRGQSLKEWLALTPDWQATIPPLGEALERLEQYVKAEQALLRAGVLYADLNLEHVIFQKDRAIVIDLEASSIRRPGELVWRIMSRRGTSETMAPEEFVRSPVTRLTERTATYRAAVVAHLVLAGYVPFSRERYWRSAYAWRRTHAAQVSWRLPRRVRRVLMAALQRHPARRYKDPVSFMAALKRAYAADLMDTNKG